MPAISDHEQSELVKERQICFHRLSQAADPVYSAMEILNGIKGILSVHRQGDTCLVIRYQLDQISLQALEEGLMSIGYRLDSGLAQRLKRAYFHFVEDNQLANMGLTANSKSTTHIFIEQYQQREHGCRDERPSYYHHYD